MSAQIVLAAWTFETTTPADLSNAANYPGFNADIGSGIASGFHVSNATDWTTPGGNGSANAFTTNTWAVGDYYQFQVSTTGFQSIALSWAQTSSSTGPGIFKLTYSSDGVSFVDFGLPYAVLVNSGVNTWTNSAPVPATIVSRDLSAIGAIGNEPLIYFRLIDASTTSAGGGTVTATGSNRIDNFTVTGFNPPHESSTLTSVPEPMTWSFGGFAALIFCVAGRHCRRASAKHS